MVGDVKPLGSSLDVLWGGVKKNHMFLEKSVVIPLLWSVNEGLMSQTEITLNRLQRSGEDPRRLNPMKLL